MKLFLSTETFKDTLLSLWFNIRQCSYMAITCRFPTSWRLHMKLWTQMNPGSSIGLQLRGWVGWGKDNVYLLL